MPKNAALFKVHNTSSLLVRDDKLYMCDNDTLGKIVSLMQKEIGVK
jgi:hypothetical protein